MPAATRRRVAVTLAAGVCAGVLLAGAATGAPREILRVDGYPVRIEYEPGDERVAARVAEICQEWIPELSDELGLARPTPIHVILIADRDRIEADAQMPLPSWGIAFALMDRQVMLVDVGRATAAWNTLDTVVPHELSHLLVWQRVGGALLPVWFVEGLAQWQAHEWSVLESWRLMEAVWVRRAPGLGRIRDGLPREESRVRDAYRVAYTGFIQRFGGDWTRLPAFLGTLAAEPDFSVAFASYWRETEGEYYARFDTWLQHKYRTRLLLFQTGPLFSILAVLFLFIVIRIKLRNRRRLQRLEQTDHGLASAAEDWRQRRPRGDI